MLLKLVGILEGHFSFPGSPICSSDEKIIPIFIEIIRIGNAAFFKDYCVQFPVSVLVFLVLISANKIISQAPSASDEPNSPDCITRNYTHHTLYILTLDTHHDHMTFICYSNKTSSFWLAKGHIIRIIFPEGQKRKAEHGNVI